MAKNLSFDYSDIRRIAIIAVFSDDYLFERVVLKGGNALALALGFEGRTSLDLDFSLENDFDDPAKAEHRLKAALDNRFATVGLVVIDFVFICRPSIPREEKPWWGGYAAEFKLMSQSRHQVVGHDKLARGREALVVGPDQQRKFTIELSKFEYTTGKVTREIDHFAVYVYAPEMIAIEKLRALCQQMPEYPINRIPSARARDFFDIHLIITETDAVLSSEENKELLRNIFLAKEVPVGLLQLIANQREFHRPDWDSVRLSVAHGALKDFDFYFDFVLQQVALLKALWEE